MWEAFDTSTEAGRMLKRLYGAGHPNIEYPQVLGKKKAAHRPFIPGGAKLDASDPRTARPKVAVKVPHRARDHPEVHAIDRVQRRKHKPAIDDTLDATRVRARGYRPPATRPVSTMDEKMRFQERCQFGGGKALPDELLHPSGPLPSEARRLAAERARVEDASRRRRGEPPPPPQNTSAPPSDVKTQLVEAINNEIAERRAFVEKMVTLGHGRTDAVRDVERQISIRTRELQRALDNLDASS
ncbi:hypothetical protein CTAYLR_009219 [Chrysophaeum taylorii]|uniref:Uncharacterized protein n=1 Tax=Chrysophaeum taylorii TaxID=2483200 RepID=A0AAD7XJD8_9STRA|nr:hypothetical protein CTAYLR_009219 [Chrysophaeum taylorii]